VYGAWGRVTRSGAKEGEGMFARGWRGSWGDQGSAGFSMPLKYAVVGLSGTLVDMAILTVLVERLGLNFAISRVISYCLSFGSNFVLNRRWTFQASGSVLKQFFLCSFGCLVSLIANWTVSVSLYHCGRFFQSFYQVAALAGTIVGVLVNYATARYWAFRSG